MVQAEAVPVGLGREAMTEDPHQVFGRDADAVVRHRCVARSGDGEGGRVANYTLGLKY